MNKFFAGGDKLTLKHLLEYMKEKGQIARFGDPVSTKVCAGQVIVESAGQSYSQVLSKCPTTGWTYFYSIPDVDVIDSDDAKRLIRRAAEQPSLNRFTPFRSPLSRCRTSRAAPKGNAETAQVGVEESTHCQTWVLELFDYVLRAISASPISHRGILA